VSAIRKEARDIRRLRVLIPTFTCRAGCRDCCGPIPFSRWEWEQVPEKKHATCLECPYSSPYGCSIYEDRPIMCRLFGTVDDPIMRCPHGCGPEKLLTAEEGARIRDAYREIVERAS
jgi:uncharacterized protein